MYKKIMNKRIRSVVVWMLVAVLQLTMVLPMVTVYAEGNNGLAGDASFTETITSGGAIGLAGEIEPYGDFIKEVTLDESTVGVREFMVETSGQINERPQVGDKLSLGLKFILEHQHDYGDGTVFIYELPQPLKAASGEGPLQDRGKNYGKYEVEAGKVKMTFNENIRDEIDNGTMGAEVNVHFGIEAEFSLGEGESKLDWEIKLPGGQEIEIDFLPEGGKIITKEVKPENEGANSQYAEWTVMVNTRMDNLGDSGKGFTDELKGNHKYEAGSLTVTRYEVNAYGKLIEPGTKIDVDLSEFNGIANSNETQKFTLENLLTGKYAYKIVYKTIPGDTEESSQVISNRATFNGGAADKGVTITYGDPLSKTVSKSGEVATWIINVNENRKTLAKDTIITDIWDSDLHVFEDSKFEDNFKFEGLTTGDYEIEENIENGKLKGFKIKLLKDIKEPFTITYKTKPKDLITGNANITNKVFRSDREDEKDAYQGYSQNVLAKSNSNINYQDKTVNWTITVNSAGYDMDEIVITDEFANKNLEIIEGNFVVEKGNKTLPAGEYELEYKDGEVIGDKKGGFTLKIAAGTKKEIITITYKTKYDVQGATNLDKYKNVVGITWDNGQYKVDNIESTVEINDQQKKKGYKEGSYNYENKEFNWEVGINYNLDTITKPVFIDTLSDTQLIDEDSITVYQLDLSKGGYGEIALKDGEPIIMTDYKLDVNENIMTIEFNNPIMQAYRIDYTSRDKDEYYEPDGAEHSIKNEAVLTGDGDYKAEWSKTVTVGYTKDLISKGFNRTSNSSAVLNWKMEFNLGQSTLDDVVIKDVVGSDIDGNPNQIINEDSFEIQEIYFKGTSDKKHYGAIHKPGDGLYTVDFNKPDSTFEIEFKQPQPIEAAYEIRYQTYYLGGKEPADLKNTATLTYTTTEKGEGSDEHKFVQGNFSVTGGASAKKAQLIVTKVDDKSGERLSGATFKLWSAKTDGFIIETVSEDRDGVYTFNRKIGQTTYYLEEYEAPKGYLKKNGRQEVNLTPEPDKNIVEIEVKNTQLTHAVLLTKTNDEGAVLEGAEFDLYSSKDQLIKESLVTDEHGKISGSDLEPGDYYFKEVKAPLGYILPGEDDERKVRFTIADGQIEVTEVTMTNNPGTGNIEVTKVDSVDTEKKLEGVTFKLTKQNDESISEELDTDADGKIVFTDLPYGKYILEEKHTLDEYILNPKPRIITLDSDEDSHTETITITNLEKDYSIQLTKYGEGKEEGEENLLEGVEFKLLKKVDESYRVVKESLITNEYGIIALKDLEAGEYQFIEVEALEGYVLDQEPIEFTIQDDQSEPQLISKVNKKIRGSIEIFKQDGSTQQPLAGATIAIYTEEDVKIDEKITDVDGKVLFEGLEYGKYYYQETNAPAGYILNDEKYPVNIEENNKTLERTLDNKKRPEDPDPEPGPGGGGGGPEDPEDPKDPDKPTKPEDPKDPEEPDKPVKPEDPKDPEDPDKPVKPVDPVGPENPDIPEEPTNPAEPEQSVTPIDPVEPPKYTRPETPDPNDPNSPEEFVLLDEDGIPRGKYTKKENPDGTFIYVDENGIPLGQFKQPLDPGDSDKTMELDKTMDLGKIDKPVDLGIDDPSVPKTGDNTPVLPMAILFIISLSSAIYLIIFKKKRYN